MIDHLIDLTRHDRGQLIRMTLLGLNDQPRARSNRSLHNRVKINADTQCRCAHHMRPKYNRPITQEEKVVQSNVLDDILSRIRSVHAFRNFLITNIRRKV